jgi:alkylation response protein AidB-like acyl-CoA dehydrogenase
LLRCGTPEQRRRWLPDMTAGRSRWCIGMSEPGAGSDLAHLTTSAVRDGEHFVVSGQKVWTSGAANADWGYLICRTDARARPHEGLSELVVAMDSPGLTVRPIRDATGDSHFCEVFFDEVRVPLDHNQSAVREHLAKVVGAGAVAVVAGADHVHKRAPQRADVVDDI